MNGKVTLALLAAAALAVGYLVWFDRDSPGTQAAALADHKLLTPVRATSPIDRLEITGPDGRIDLALGSNREWRVLAPTPDRADVGAVRDLVGALETATKFDAIPVSPAALEQFGLRDPAVRIRIHRAGETPVELQLGLPTAVEGRAYARLDGSPEIAVVPDVIRQMARRPPEEFRDGLLLKVRPVDVSRITIQNPSGTIELQRERGRWEMLQPIAAQADEKKVNDWLERLRTTAIRQFVGEDLGDLISYGLAAPRGSVRLDIESASDGGNPPVEIFFGNRADPRFAPDSVYVRVPGRQLVAAVPLGMEEALLFEADALRDRTLFVLNSDLVDRIHVRPAGGVEIVLARRGDDWSMLKPVAADAEASEAMRLLKRLPGIRVRDFLSGEAARIALGELEPPRLQVTFASFSSENTPESVAGEMPIATLSFGPVRPDGSILVRVKGEGEPVIARVDASILSMVPTNPIAWQPLRIVNEPAGSIDAFAIEGRAGPRAYSLDGGVWHRVDSPSAMAPASIESAAGLIAQLRAVRWVGPAVETHGLDAPTLVVRCRVASGSKAMELRLGRRTAEGLWPGEVKGRNGVFLLSDPDYQILQGLAQ